MPSVRHALQLSIDSDKIKMRNDVLAQYAKKSNLRIDHYIKNMITGGAHVSTLRK